MTQDTQSFTVIVPAAGVGKRMNADRPKQYLKIGDKTVLEHTVEKLITHPKISHIVIALDPQDPYFESLPLSQEKWITRVDGGSQRADSVLAGLDTVTDSHWVAVHDAARPCVNHHDLDQLFSLCHKNNGGGILAMTVKDTMKRAQQNTLNRVANTVDREGLWHALTPQLFPLEQLRSALHKALAQGVTITDEASAMEWAGWPVNLVEGSERNIKITRPNDLPLATFYLSQEE
ncbi:2-C-methyl-D-erythritol 4-phosphate cytidylyltransferase [Aliiglaciecola sp. 3_MG-2023]|uniref:2-C-methyl-D-erythritol 4-phosphate cytidylyltransferase n=1 Tax=Aliiglaciecola sp. 3_MG-2023 TaxID=3062644 RepID=UPI0026E39BA7|nr:2-C-methyl-D-erythritol 4-phosphate cytidylyltransferase [Aliiglaciecola sp. 3_MG-2023]MDO6692262.1 2-C-methyl-D-erythritol 4-phosphate cytidylyltransferase [Aliiglaciecola sp. 3_MG-2023]